MIKESVKDVSAVRSGDVSLTPRQPFDDQDDQNGGKENNGPAAILTFRRPDEILALEFDDSDNLMGDRLLCSGGRLVIIGPGGIGKSFFLLQMAAANITGRDFLCFPTRGAGLRWLVIQAEDNNRRLRFDMERLKKLVGETDWPAVCDNLLIHTLETEMDFWLHIATDRAAFDRARDAVQRFNPHIVGFDPLNHLTTGDLNKDVDMRLVCEAMSGIARAPGNTGRAVAVLHHSLTGIAGTDKAIGMDRASFGRNSKVLHAWARSVVNLAPVNEDNSQLIASSGKNNNGAEFKKFAIRRDADTLLFHHDREFDIEQWVASRNKRQVERPQPSHDQVLSLFRHNEENPRSCLLKATELRAAFLRRQWDVNWAPALRDELESAGKLKVYHGPRGVKLAGLPAMVDAFAALEGSRDTLLEQAPLPTRKAKRKRR